MLQNIVPKLTTHLYLVSIISFLATARMQSVALVCMWDAVSQYFSVCHQPEEDVLAKSACQTERENSDNKIMIIVYCKLIITSVKL